MSSLRRLVIAVSGGVDSVVLLDALVNHRLNELTTQNLQPTTYEIVVAHVDHGIRSDSADDAQWVSELAAHYGCDFTATKLRLGVGASEEAAREERYSFLRQVCNTNGAQLVTAHHQNDLVETMIINLLRGTSWRGLAPMTNFEIWRPLINAPKQLVLEYAKKYQLSWREDSTNQNQEYLRNYIRLTLLPKLLSVNLNITEQLLTINEQVRELGIEIATELQNYINEFAEHDTQNRTYEIDRYQLVMLPTSVAHEVIYYLLTQLDTSWHPTGLQIKRALLFAKSAQNGKQLEVSKSLLVGLHNGSVQFKKV